MKELLSELMVEPLQELVVSEPVEILEVLKNHMYYLRLPAIPIRILKMQL